jgi:predicted AlkP superfamily pyrophosphatase or phosphodiesterase
MKHIRTLIRYIISILISSHISYTASLSLVTPPRLTVVIVVDQLPYWQFHRLAPYFKEGLRTLIDNGINYTNAHYPHAHPDTAGGHTGLQTGVYPKDHGIISDKWYTNYVKIFSTCDNRDTSLVFNPNGGMYNYGESAQLTFASGISDEYMLATTKENPHHVYSVSLKSRSAIATASKMGKAIWLDYKSYLFTSSMAYFSQLPAWLVNFNATNWILHKKYFMWNLAYPNDYLAYQFHNPRTYQFVESGRALVGRRFESHKPLHYASDKDIMMLLTPFANQLIFDLAHTCIKQTLHKKSNDHMLMWVCLGATDKLAHKYGPDCKESIDILYHLDKQLGAFMKTIAQYVKPDDTLIILTSDHGGAPMPELMKERGLINAHRINLVTLITTLNAKLTAAFPELHSAVLDIRIPSLYLDERQLALLSPFKQEEVITFIKQYLTAIPGIKQVWTYAELNALNVTSNDIEHYYKNQLYPHRSGSIQIQLNPYSILSKTGLGSEHHSPYNYDTHVPLIVYRPGVYQYQTYNQKVWMLQCANTLAHILDVAQPSTSLLPLLPPFVNQH